MKNFKQYYKETNNNSNNEKIKITSGKDFIDINFKNIGIYLDTEIIIDEIITEKNVDNLTKKIQNLLILNNIKLTEKNTINKYLMEIMNNKQYHEKIMPSINKVIEKTNRFIIEEMVQEAYINPWNDLKIFFSKFLEDKLKKEKTHLSTPYKSGILSDEN